MRSLEDRRIFQDFRIASLDSTLVGQRKDRPEDLDRKLSALRRLNPDILIKECQDIGLGQGLDNFCPLRKPAELVPPQLNFWPNLIGLLIQVLGLLQMPVHHSLTVRGELLVAHGFQEIPKEHQEGLNPVVQALGIHDFGLDDESRVQHSPNAGDDAREHDVPELFLGAELVEARFLHQVHQQLQSGRHVKAAWWVLVGDLESDLDSRIFLCRIQGLPAVDAALWTQWELNNSHAHGTTGMPLKRSGRGDGRGHHLRAGERLRWSGVAMHEHFEESAPQHLWPKIAQVLEGHFFQRSQSVLHAPTWALLAQDLVPHGLLVGLGVAQVAKTLDLPFFDAIEHGQRQSWGCQGLDHPRQQVDELVVVPEDQELDALTNCRNLEVESRNVRSVGVLIQLLVYHIHVEHCLGHGLGRVINSGGLKLGEEICLWLGEGVVMLEPHKELVIAVNQRWFCHGSGGWGRP
mmetsp:Transcript_30589/g.88885  ORF Transcript_30589/g.88885 Transcript_30589/m.88885 type:complete len:462 (-) Transcript_30589:947-2332(-)